MSSAKSAVNINLRNHEDGDPTQRGLRITNINGHLNRKQVRVESS
jgi:hypothetical protein